MTEWYPLLRPGRVQVMSLCASSPSYNRISTNLNHTLDIMHACSPAAHSRSPCTACMHAGRQALLRTRPPNKIKRAYHHLTKQQDAPKAHSSAPNKHTHAHIALTGVDPTAQAGRSSCFHTYMRAPPPSRPPPTHDMSSAARTFHVLPPAGGLRHDWFDWHQHLCVILHRAWV
jgi:hypothetical protein